VALAASAVGLGRIPGSAGTDLDLDRLRANGWFRQLETVVLPTTLAGHEARMVTSEVAGELQRSWERFSQDNEKDSSLN
jgi:hypothetical protein